MSHPWLAGTLYFRNVTQMTEGDRCGWCRRELVPTGGRGRPRRYCRQSCRQRAYELRRRQLAGTLQSNEVPITLTDFERLRDGLYVVSSALDDVDLDLSEDGDYEAAFRHLYAAASGLRRFDLVVATQG